MKVLSLPRLACAAFALLPGAYAQETAPTDPTGPDYLRIVRDYAEAMIDPARGRDRFGPEPTPLFATVLDRETYTIPEGRVDDLYRARVPQEFKHVANPHLDQNLLQILEALTRLTGEEHYAKEAERTLEYFLTHCQEPRFGFFAWGEHLGWDLAARTMGGFPEEGAGNGAIHEFLRPWIYWEQSFELAPESCARFARALWKHQIFHGGERISWSRHAMLKSLTPNRSGFEFPRHGGFYIATWAHAWNTGGDPEMLRAIEAVADYFLSVRDPATGAIPHCSSQPHHWFRPESTVSLAVSLEEAAPLVPAPLDAKLRELARSIDEAFLRLPHDPGPGGRGLVLTADTRDLSLMELWHVPDGPAKGWHREQPPGTTLPPRHKSYTEGWVSAYVGPVPHSTLIGFCIARNRQVPQDGYRDLILRTADGYLASAPDLEPYEVDGTRITPKVDAGTVGRVIGLLNEAYRLTRKDGYLLRSEWFCDWAAERFWPDAQPLPLPSVPASAKQNYYSASSRCDTLAMHLLETWLLRHRPEAGIEFRWTDL